MQFVNHCNEVMNHSPHEVLLVVFYGISTFIGYLMPNPIYVSMCNPLAYSLKET